MYPVPKAKAACFFLSGKGTSISRGNQKKELQEKAMNPYP